MSLFRPLLVVAACFGALAPSGVHANSTASAAAAKLEARAARVSQEVAKLRGLEVKKPIDRGVMSKAQIRARILEVLDREYTPEELASESLGLKRLGLIPQTVDYAKMMVDLLQDQIAGFYDQHEKKLYIAGWAQAGGDMPLAHEIDHALQDQHFDLVTFMARDRRNGDSMTARQALVEGDGMATMLEFQMAAGKQAPPWGSPMIMGLVRKGVERGASRMKHVPLAVREGLMFPYVGGLEFIAYFRKHHKWSVIDAMYKKPPLSTEHILHPEKYEAYEMPVSVMISQPEALAGYSEKVSNVLGEKGIELFLRTHGVSRARAAVAGAGWGGDRLAVYAKAGHKGSRIKGTVGLWLTSWDEELDAREFYEALEHALPKLSGQKGRRSASVLSFVAGGTTLVAERRGSQVLLLLGAPKDAANGIRSDVWKGASYAVPKP